MTTVQTGLDSQDVLENLAQAPSGWRERARAIVGMTDHSAVRVAYPAPSEAKVFVCSNAKQGTCWIFVFVFSWLRLGFPWFSKLFDSLCFSGTLGDIYGPNSPGENYSCTYCSSPPTTPPVLTPATIKLPICPSHC